MTADDARDGQSGADAAPTATEHRAGQGGDGPNRTSLILALVAVVAAIALIVGYMFISGSGGGSSSGGGSAAENASGAEGSGDGNSPADGGGLSFLARRIEGDPLALGDVDAPVVFINYSDYRCPFCAKFSRDVEPEIISEYVEAGLVRLEWRDVPIFGEQSMLGARAGRAAAEQGKFWEFNAAVYAEAPESGHAELTEDSLVEFARKAGVPDLEAFRADMMSDRFDRDIMADANEAASIGINSTPSFIVGEGAVAGAQPREVFIQAIESQLPAEGN